MTPSPLSTPVIPSLEGRIEAQRDVEPWELFRRTEAFSSAGPAFVWESPHGEAIAAVGTAARFEWHGAERFSEARRWIDAVLSTARFEGGDRRRALLALGGFAFTAGDGRAADAEPLPDAALHVPELVWRGFPGRSTTEWSWRAIDDSASPAERPGPAPPHARAFGGSSWTEVEWNRAVAAALEAIRAGALEKVVLARSRESESDLPWDVIAVYEALRADHPTCYRFFYRDGRGNAFLGASPERLVSLRGGRVEADAVAGTVRQAFPRDEAGAVDADAEEALALSLAADPKERREHDIVVLALRETLQSLCEGCVAEGPAVQRLRHVLHLRSRVTAAARPGAHILSLIERVHPTPAVAGTPRPAALEFLARWEPRGRGWYAGPIGWMNGAGEGDFTVGLRSVLVRDNRALFFAGAGVVAGSEPDLERNECEVKMRSVEEALTRG